jgi:hypothetical protein
VPQNQYENHRKSTVEILKDRRGSGEVEVRVSNMSISAAEKLKGRRRGRVAISQNDLMAE